MNSLTKIIIICAMGVLASGILVFFVVGPVVNDVSTLNAGVKAKKVQSAELDQQILAYKTAEASLAKASSKDQILNIIPTKENLVSAVKDVEAAVNQSNVGKEDLQIIEYNGPNQTPPPPVVNGKIGLNEVVYKLSVEGDYVGLERFISDLEHLPEFTEINKITMSAIATANANGELIYTGQASASLDGVFFIQNQNAAN